MASVPLIRYGGNSIVQQPYAIQQVRGCGFSVDGDHARMQALCDRTLNLPGSPVRYRVLSKSVLLTFMHMGRLIPTLPPDDAKGFFIENELNVTMLLAAGREIGEVFIPNRLVWYMPYLWLDSSEAMIAGRDVYGFPKHYGEIAMPPAEGRPALFEAVGEVLHTFSAATPATLEPILRARRTDATAFEHEPALLAFDDAIRTLFWQAISIEDPVLFTWTVGRNLTKPDWLKLVFLRQLVSISDGTRACYQSVAEAPFHLTRFGGAGFLRGAYEVEIFPHASVPFAAELGIASPGSSRILLNPRTSFFVDIDFILDAGQEIWVTT